MNLNARKEIIPIDILSTDRILPFIPLPSQEYPSKRQLLQLGTVAFVVGNNRDSRSTYYAVEFSCRMEPTWTQEPLTTQDVSHAHRQII